MSSRRRAIRVLSISRLTACIFLLPTVIASPQQEQLFLNRFIADLGEGDASPPPLHPPEGHRNQAEIKNDHYKHVKDTLTDPNRESAIATLAPARDAAVRAPHPAQKSDRSANPSSLLQARSLQDWEVEDFLLLATVDGSIHARDRRTGAPRWALEVENPMVETTYHRPNKSAVQDARPEDDFFWIVEPSRDGDIYIYNPSSDAGLQRLRLTVRKLEELSPYAGEDVGEDPAVVYTTEKRTTMYTVDANTGHIRKRFSSRGASMNEDSCRPASGLANRDAEECASTGHFILGRTEYTIAIQDKRTAQSVCTLKYSEWGPNNRDIDLHSKYGATTDQKYVYARHDGSVFSFDHSSLDRRRLYFQKLPSPVVRAFDVARPVASKREDDPQLVLLPRPMGAGDDVEGSRPLAGRDRIFVNQTDAGGWYALSEETYPTVTGTAPRAMCDNPDWNAAGIPFHLLPAEQQQKALVGVHVLSDQSPNRDRSRLTISGPPGQGADGSPLLLAAGPSTEGSGILPQSQIISKAAANATDILVALVILLALTFVSVNWRYFFRRLRHLLELRQDPSEAKAPLKPAIKSVPATPVTGEFPKELASDVDGFDSDATALPEQASPQPTPTPSRRNTLLEPPTPARSRASSVDEDRGRQRSGPRVRIIEPSLSPGPGGEEDGLDGQASGKKKARRGCRGGNKHKKKRANSGKSDDTEGVEQMVEEVKQINKDFPTMEPDVVEVNGSTSASDVSGPVIQIGHLKVYTDSVLGFGSHGTVVYKGSFGGRDVAVKRMLLEFYDIASHEVGLLQESDDHPNVIRYYDKESAGDFLYIALELCPASLQDVVDRPTGYPTLLGAGGLDVPDILQQITAGLRYLHSLKIVHRDIKPQNILLAAPKKLPANPLLVPPPRLLISDFGLCKKLEGDQSSFRATTAHAAGTSGWRAPELLVDDDAASSTGTATTASTNPSMHSNSEPLVVDPQSNRRATRAIDVFSLGCVFYYVLTGGAHPFDRDGKYMREANIVKGRYALHDLDRLGDYQWEAKDLVARMLAHDPRARPDAAAVLAHPFFWPAGRRLDFLGHVSDQFEWEPREPASPALTALEARAPALLGPCGGDFLRPLPAAFKDTLGRQRKYAGGRLLDLLRALRNKRNHYEDMPEHVRDKVGPLPAGYLGFWTRRFPGLLMACHGVVLELGWETKDRFRAYYAV